MSAFRVAWLNACVVVCVVLFAVAFFPNPPSDRGTSDQSGSDARLVEAARLVDEESGPAARLVDDVVIVVIDALRFDFISRMPRLQSHVAKAGLLAKIRTHTPTVTLPRIKSIVTGTIPGFLDVLSNMASSQLTQDNVVSRAARNNVSVSFYGDDTWLGLFPSDVFEFAHGVPSFFVSDYTHVDLAVSQFLNRSHILRVRSKSDPASLTILHYLGLDHIGHLEGPRSSLMPAKLDEMDRVVDALVEHAPTDRRWAVLVTGDHGMSDQGSHGGATDPEIHSACALIAPSILTTPSAPLDNAPPAPLDTTPLWDQVDISAIVGSFLGLGVPRTSLGVVPSQITAQVSDSARRTLEASTSKRLLALCQTSSSCAASLPSLTTIVDVQRVLCETAADYHVPTLLHAITTMLLVCISCHRSDELLRCTPLRVAMVLIVFAASLAALPDTLLPLSVRVLLEVPLIVCVVMTACPPLRFNRMNVCMTVMFAAHCLTVFGSSLIEEEHYFFYFISQTACALALLSSRRHFFWGMLIIRCLKGFNQTGIKWAHLPDGAALLGDSPLGVQAMVVCGSVASLWPILPSRHRFFVPLLVCVKLVQLGVTPDFVSFDTMARICHVVLCAASCLEVWLFRHSTSLAGGGFCDLCLVAGVVILRCHQTVALVGIFWLSWIVWRVDVEWPVDVVVAVWLARTAFFALDNSNSFSTIDSAAPFVGVSAFSPVPCAILGVLAVGVGPLIVLLRFLAVLPRHRALQTAAIFTAYSAIYSTCVMASLTLHRHHLFVWTVFAPKFFYECGWVIFFSFASFILILCSKSSLI